jgi:tetratricopeptide (TPR) repeat protein
LTLIGRAYEAIDNRAAAAISLDRAVQARRGEPTVFQLAAAQSGRAGDPDNADIAIPRINAMALNGELASALIAAERLRDLNPGTPAAHVLVGDVLTMLGRPVDAASAYRAAANLQFSEATAMRFVAALQQANQGPAALRVLDLYLGQNPRSVPALRLAADHLMATGQWDRAIGVLDGLRLRLGNRDATLLANLGWAWFSKGDMDKATVFAEAAYTLAPSNPAVAKGYGLILSRSGKDKARGLALIKKAANSRLAI